MDAPEADISRSVQIINQRGLHARASAKFVQTVNRFDAQVNVRKDGVSVGGTSIMGLMMLAASPGCYIDISASGPDSAAVVDALVDLIGNRFGEEI